jgi:NhaP-type Na+/H+ or K+/H+ antiporter
VSAVAFWEEVNLILSAVLFFMAGRALPEAVAGLRDWPLGWLLGVAAGLLALVLAVQFAFSLAAAALPHPAEELGTREAPATAPARASVAGVMAWASTRSVIGLVIALSVPAALPDGRPFAERDLILAVAALLIVGSVLLQGLTLGAVVRRAGLGERAETEAERGAAQGGDREGPRRDGTGAASTPGAARSWSCAGRTGSATRSRARCCARRTCASARPRRARSRAPVPRTPERARPARTRGAEPLNLGDAVLVVDETGFIKKGRHSAGWPGSTAGRLGGSGTPRLACSSPTAAAGATR